MDPTKAVQAAQASAEASGTDSIIMLFTVFVLAVFVGY